MQGMIVNYFSSLDMDEMRNMGWCKRIMGILCRVLPLVLKLFHFLKMILVIFTSFTVYFTTVSDAPDANITNTTYIENCDNVNFNKTLRVDYDREKIIYQTVEGSVTMFVMCCLCICKTFCDINTFCYEPLDVNANRWKKLAKTLGP